MIDPCSSCGCDLEREPVKYEIEIREMHPAKDISKNRAASFDLCERCYQERFGPMIDLEGEGQQ